MIGDLVIKMPSTSDAEQKWYLQVKLSIWVSQRLFSPTGRSSWLILWIRKVASRWSYPERACLRWRVGHRPSNSSCSNCSCCWNWIPGRSSYWDGASFIDTKALGFVDCKPGRGQ
jgi:hypothetical protein